MNDSWIWTMVQELTGGAEGVLGEGGQREKNWDNCNRTTIKNMLKKKKMRENLKRQQKKSSQFPTGEFP